MMPATRASLPPKDWRPITGYEGFYEISDHGRLRSLERRVDLKHRYGGSIRHKRTGAEMLPTPDRNGRLQVCLSRDGRLQYRGVASLVLEAFGTPLPPGCLVVHRDDDKGNCALANLTWRPRGSRRPAPAERPA